MAVVAAPAAATAARTVAGRAAGTRAAGSRGAAARARASSRAPKKKAAAAGTQPPGGGKGGGGKGTQPQGGGRGVPQPEGRAKKAKRGRAIKASLAGATGKYRRALVAEFVICSIIVGLSPLSRPDGEYGPVRWMKRGTSVAAMFIVLGLVSAAGKGAARAAAYFGGLVTLVLLVDQREVFGRLAVMLTERPEDDDVDPVGVGPVDSGPDLPDVVAT